MAECLVCGGGYWKGFMTGAVIVTGIGIAAFANLLYDPQRPVPLVTGVLQPGETQVITVEVVRGTTYEK